MLNILIVDNQVLFRDGIRLILENEPDFHVADVASSGQQALEKLKTGLDISLVVMEWNIPQMDGRQFIDQLKQDYPDIAAVVLTMSEDQNVISEAFNCGIKAYVSKASDSGELVLAVRQAVAGKIYLCSHLTSRVLNKPVPADPVPESKSILTVREQEVLSMVANGLTNKEIADKLFTSRRTVEGYRQKLLTKTGTTNTATLIRFAIECNMVG